jgi:xanthine dehydrogenase iron-sulfur cluster and FAD-binding subunit A
VVLVALGVALELATVPHSLMEVAALSKEVQDLRAKNDALEFKAQDRTTTPEQMAIFKRILQNAPKGPIMLGTRHPNHETVKYENKIEDMLTNSGFTIQSMINYGNNILTMNEGSSVALVIESQTNAPKFTFLLEQAFKAAGIETTGFVNPPVNVFGNEPRPGSNEILVLVVEKP